MKFIGITWTPGWLSALGLLALVAAGCAGRKSTIGSEPQAGGAGGTSTAEAVTKVDSSKDSSTVAVSGQRAAADALWPGRGNPDTARLALAAYLQAASSPDANSALLARLSRAFYLVANYVETGEAAKDSLFLEGVKAAEQAMSLHPGFVKVFRETKDEKQAVRELGPESLEAMYWYSANLGKWASTKSLMVRLGNKSKLEAYNQRVMDIDEGFFHGAPHRFFGVLPTKVPGGDLKASKKHFEAAIAIEPNYFGTRTLFAENYATKAQDKQTYLTQLDYVLSTPPSALPDAEPENRYEQALAKRLKEKTDELFD